jgi:ankyrin repeat protein
LFTIPDGTDSLRFSRVHEAVLGHKAESLTQALDEDLVNMDQPDANGRTPISWAAARGDETAVRVLIEHLADIPFADLGGMTPLHHAATSTSKQCLDLLLEHGGDPSAKDKDRGWTPLHYAAFHQADPSWVEELLARGANVNVTTDNLKSPLVLAIMKCHDLAARALIKHGALIDARGSDGFTPLNATLMSNDSACMQALIDAGIRFDEVAWEGRTILHMVALYSDEKMIDCLIKEDLACLDVDAIDDAGETALMLLKCRAVSARMMKAFARLCSKISDDVSKRAQVHRPGDKRREDDSQEEVNHG